MSHKLIFCFDGTWNGRDDEVPTNIRRIHRGARGNNQISFYFAGPGNEDENNWLGEKLGGMFGWGTNDILADALATLNSVFRFGDSIYVFGFSRGAMIARLFCAAIAKNGVHQFFPLIRFLGCFDTVAAFLPSGPAQQGIWHDLHVHWKVMLASHALALDENRAAFEPNLMNKREGINEVWFPGVHADIGGGFKDHRLSDVTLDWMVAQAINRSGLRIQLDHDLEPDATAPIGDAGGVWRRHDRRVGVMVDDSWSEEEPVIYNSS